MNFKAFFLLILFSFSSIAGDQTCSDHLSEIISLEKSEAVLEGYNKQISDLPKELQLAVNEGILKEEYLTNYLSMQAKWDKRGKRVGELFKNSGLWRSFIENPKFMKDWLSNLGSGAATTVICHIPYLKQNALYDSPMLTTDVLTGFFTDSLLSFTATKNPSYLEELKKRGLTDPTKVELATKKFNAIVDRAKEVAFKNYLKRKKQISSPDNPINDLKYIPEQYKSEAKRHLKGMGQLSFYFSIAGGAGAIAFRGVQAAMSRVGVSLADPYVGFNILSEMSYAAQFSIHAYTRIVLTDKLVGKTRAMIDDVFEGMKTGYYERAMKNGEMLDPVRLAMYDQYKTYMMILGTVGIYFASNLWATDVFMRWRESGFDNSILLNPYQEEMKPYLDAIKENLSEMEENTESMISEIESEIAKMDDYRWWMNH